MIYTMTLSPALDRTLVVPGFSKGRVNRVQRVIESPGGKGINVSSAIRALGGDSLALGLVGGATGDAIEAALNHAGVRHSFVHVPVATRINTKVVDPESHATTDINEPGAPVDSSALTAVLSKADAMMAAGDDLVLAGRLPPGVQVADVTDWLGRLIGRGVRVCLDAEGDLLRKGILPGLALVKPNAEEFAGLTGFAGSSEQDIAREAQRVAGRGVGCVIVSLGSRGAVFAQADRAVYVPAIRVPVFSTVGAGDAMVAAAVLAQQQGLPLEALARYAVAAASAKVSAEGIAGLTPAAVAALAERAEVVSIKF
ncbi:MAG: 1-phosphofructokinase family hexose kinase [Christensenellales bacterium]|jgi:1-phosphofructokinase